MDKLNIEFEFKTGHLFEIPIQAAVGGKIIARETVKAMRKHEQSQVINAD